MTQMLLTKPSTCRPCACTRGPFAMCSGLVSWTKAFTRGPFTLRAPITSSLIAMLGQHSYHLYLVRGSRSGTSLMVLSHFGTTFCTSYAGLSLGYLPDGPLRGWVRGRAHWKREGNEYTELVFDFFIRASDQTEKSRSNKVLRVNKVGFKGNKVGFKYT